MKSILFFMFFLLGGRLLAQQVGVNTQTPHPTAALEIADSSRGILIPRMTMAQRNAIQNPAEGLMVYQTDSAKGFWYWDGLNWLFNNSSNSNSNLTSRSRYFFKLGGWSSGNCAQCYVSNIVFWNFNNYINKYSTDSLVQFNNATGEITFYESGVYKINIQAIVGSQAYGAQLMYFSTILNSWVINNDRIVTLANYSSYSSGYLYTDVQCLQIVSGDKLKFMLAPSTGNQGKNISVGSGALEIERLN